MNRIIIIATITIASLVSCNNKGNTADPIKQESVLAYYPLTVGNLWIYQTSSCDSTWENCDYTSIDTNIVAKDTLINGLTYFKIEGKKLVGSEPHFLRDSLDYIVDNYGKVRFSNKDFSTIFNEEFVISDNDTIYHWYYKMQEDPIVVELPFRTFTCLDNKLSFFRKKENFEFEFNGHSFYSKGFGLVYETALFASSTGGMKRELIDYQFLTTHNK